MHCNLMYVCSRAAAQHGGSQGLHALQPYECVLAGCWALCRL